MLLALSQIRHAAGELVVLPGFDRILDLLSLGAGVPLIAGLVLTYLAHSSIAVILLVASLAETGLIPLDTALFLVLGANIGSALLPVLATWRGPSNARVSVIASLLLRALGVGALVATVPWVSDVLAGRGAVERVPALFHLSVNVVVGLAGLMCARPLLAVATRAVPEDAVHGQPTGPRYLSNTELDTPARALACAKCEALVMGDLASEMVTGIVATFDRPSPDRLAAIVALDDSLDRLFEAIKIYLARVMKRELSDEETRRALDLLSFITNMKHIGDIVEGSLGDLLARKNELGIGFSAEGLAEITALHDRVCENFDLAIDTFLTDDGALVRQLYDAKAAVRRIERASVETHIERLGSGRADSLNTSGLYIAIDRDLKRINGHLTAVAYPVLLLAGKVPRTRWKHREKAA